MTKKKTPTKIIEEELTILGELVCDESRLNVRVSKDTFDAEGNIINRGGSLRDSIQKYAKGKRLTMTQLDYGRWQKPKELGTVKWSPPADRNSQSWDNPMITAIQKHLPESINVIAKDLIKNIVGK